MEADTALVKISEGLDELLAAGASPADCDSAVAAIRAVESAGRKMAAVQVDLLAAIDDRVLYAADAHRSAKVMMRHVGKLSAGEAAGRAKTAKMMAELPALADRFRSGDIGVDQVNLLGRVHGNRRVRLHMADAEDWFVKAGDRFDFFDFEAAVRQWERLANSDGPEPSGVINRSAALRQNGVDLSWELRGSFSSMMGTAMNEIFEHYISAETLADWEKAKAEHGDDATIEHLARTAAKRRADALWQIFQDAATNPTSATPVGWVHNIVWHADSYQEMLRRLAGAQPGPIDPDTFRCSTIDGVPVDPHQAVAHSLIDRLRRVVTDANSVVIDLGRARAFTGSARLAAQLTNTHCIWPGCRIPASQCQIDHTIAHAKGGTTSPVNAGPLCGHHNRSKERGFTVWRDPAGTWHTRKPDGTRVE